MELPVRPEVHVGVGNGEIMVHDGWSPSATVLTGTRVDWNDLAYFLDRQQFPMMAFAARYASFLGIRESLASHET